MHPIILSLLLGLTAAAANVFGGAIIVQKHWDRSYLRYFVALGAGFMLATAIVEVFPAALELRGKSAAFLVLVGYLIIHFFEHTTITEEQRAEFGQLVEDTIRRVESAQFLPHSGIRFPQNPCSSCPYIGLCLGKPELINIALARRPGAENLGWLDELAY